MKEYVIGILCVVCLFLSGTCLFLVKTDNKCHHHRPYDDTEFQFVVTDSLMSVYNNEFYVGTVKVQGQLDSLLVDYNQ